MLDSVTMLCYNTAIRRNNVTQRKEVSRIDQDGLISKKELLERYGISYGALYRWKRKGLIPEEWFLKKATVTGQETFFPEQLVCGRVELILRQKDAVSLDELARQLGGTKAKTGTLILDTIFGEKRFEAGDLQRARIAFGSRETDITDVLKDYLNGYHEGGNEHGF